MSAVLQSRIELDENTQLPYNSGCLPFLAMAPKPKSFMDRYGSILALVISALTLVGIGGGGTLYIASKFEETNKNINQTGTRVTKLESSVKALASKQDDQTKDLIKELLSEARKRVDANQTEVASRSVRAAAALVAAQAKDKTPASSAFLTSAARDFAELSVSKDYVLTDASFDGMQALAGYSSNLRQVPADLRNYSNTTAPKSGQFFNPGNVQDLRDIRIVVDRSYIHDGRLTLDGIEWRGVVFENMDIEYNGGPVIIDNVEFVNCRFSFRPLPRSRELLLASIEYSSRIPSFAQ